MVRKANRPTFIQFIDYLLRTEVFFTLFSLITCSEQRSLSHFLALLRFSGDCFKQVIPIQVKEYNDHWRPYWLHCNICRLDYDVFVKFETISEDTTVIEGKITVIGGLAIYILHQLTYIDNLLLASRIERTQRGELSLSMDKQVVCTL